MLFYRLPVWFCRAGYRTITKRFNTVATLPWRISMAWWKSALKAASIALQRRALCYLA
jgi:hypothetical protein